MVTLEPWKGPSYTRRNLPFAIGVGGGAQARRRTTIHPEEVEDTVSTSWEEVETQLDKLEYQDSFEEVGDNFDIFQPAPKETKSYQSSFSLDCEDMASPYGSSGEWSVTRFSSTAGTIEIEDFEMEFTMWYEFQKSRNKFPSIHIWCGGRCLGAWKGSYCQIIESFRLQISLRF